MTDIIQTSPGILYVGGFTSITHVVMVKGLICYHLKQQLTDSSKISWSYGTLDDFFSTKRNLTQLVNAEMPKRYREQTYQGILFRFLDPSILVEWKLIDFQWGEDDPHAWLYLDESELMVHSNYWERDQAPEHFHECFQWKELSWS